MIIQLRLDTQLSLTDYFGKKLQRPCRYGEERLRRGEMRKRESKREVGMKALTLQAPLSITSCESMYVFLVDNVNNSIIMCRDLMKNDHRRAKRTQYS